jgi:hypothetical protein
MQKEDIIKYCYESFLKAFATVDPEVHFIIDKPTFKIIKLLEKCPFKNTMHTVKIDGWYEGNIYTFHKQLDAAAQHDGKVMFLEDDYMFLENAGSVLDSALDTLEFITPYDHPALYTEFTEKRNVIIAGGHHFQNVTSTTLTFATHGKLIKRLIDKMKSFNIADSPMWQEITKEYQLYAPIPSLATHMEQPYLAPVIDWGYL